VATLRPVREVRLPSYAVRDGNFWVAECIPLGVASQGDSLEETLNLLAEATEETIANLLALGKDPLTAARPSKESITEFAALQAQAHVEVTDLNVPDNVRFVVLDLLMSIPASDVAKSRSRYVGVAAPISMAC